MRAQFPNETSEWMDKWLRRHTPMRDRVFRNTRKTMREYQAAGIIPESVVIPHRHVEDEFIPLAANERHLYDRIEEYIRRHYNAYKNDQGNKALGFIMTVYRRRLTSSFEAIKRSLQRRLERARRRPRASANCSPTMTTSTSRTRYSTPRRSTYAPTVLRDEIANSGRSSPNSARLPVRTPRPHASCTTSTKPCSRTRRSSCSPSTPTRWTTSASGSSRPDTTKLGCYSGRGGELYDPATKTWTASHEGRHQDEVPQRRPSRSSSAPTR